MKSYTDLEQSKKLAEILPIESADMCWCNNSIRGINYTDEFEIHTHTLQELKEVFDSALIGWDKYWELIPAWSLAALLDLLDDVIINDEGNEYSLTISKEEGMYYIHYHDSWGQVDDIETDFYDDFVDACYEMILKLHKQKLL